VSAGARRHEYKEALRADAKLAAGPPAATATLPVVGDEELRQR
jgi:hypothetical protein